MSVETVDLAGQVVEAIGRRDVEHLIALSHPEVEWHSFFRLGEEGGVYRGHDGTRQYLSDLDEVWEIGRADVDDVLAVGAIAVVVGRIHYRGRGSGVEADAPAGWVLKFRDGKLLRFRAFRDPEQALEVARLQE
jgi:ketosteroid isomerase-like protein